MSNLNLYDVIRRPVITEKSSIFSEPINDLLCRKYTFVVAKFADKTLINKAVEAIFGVKVRKVNILNIKGKSKRFRGRIGRRSDYKKAIVTLERDHSIDLTNGVK